jgi:hypothetical protein
MAKFNGLLELIKSPTCTSTVGILHQGKSRLLDEWRRLDTRITEEANEAKDNVKYLYTLDKFCEPLYKCTPVCSSSLLVGVRWSVLMCLCVLAGEIAEAIPGLINASRMIHFTPFRVTTTPASERQPCLSR